MRALVTGATGFVGRRLIESLRRPVVLTRRPQVAKDILADVEAYLWDPVSGPPPAGALQGIDVVFHLAGDSVGRGRWTKQKKQRIFDSRVLGTRNLVRAMESLESPPKLLVCASAIGFYGPRGDEPLEESAAPGNDFLAQVCLAAEQAAAGAGQLGTGVVTPRLGIVLGPGGGALSRMLLPFKLGVGGRLGHGRQWMSWVHLDDVVGLLLHSTTANINGALNVVSPHPVTNREFTRTLGCVLHRPAILPMPALVLRVMLGEVAEVLVGSQRVVPRKAMDSGYQFRFPELEPALAAAV